jgi:TolB protein
MQGLVRRVTPLIASLAVMAAVLLPANAAHAANPGANGLVTYGHRVSGDIWEIRAMNPDGTGDRVLIPDAGQITWLPAWDPQGQRVSFERGACCFSLDIWVAKADGSGAKNITNSPEHETGSSWSPDGKQIAFARVLGDHEIFTMNADGSNQQRLTTSPGVDASPSWSPGGTKIAFYSERDGNAEIYVMNSDGSNQVALTKNPAGDYTANWSPDGKRIAFVSNRDGNNEIYVMNANGTHQVRLTNDGGSDENPAWSPDGTKIAFSSNRTGAECVYTMNADGSDQTRASAIPGDARWPSWRPMTKPSKTVTVSDTGFTPQDVRLALIKDKHVVTWNFTGMASHAVADGSGMGVFGSGSEPPGGAYAAGFQSAGTYDVLDPTTLATGTVSLPPTADPPSGPPGTTFTVTWSLTPPHPGFVFDVQLKSPGSNSWVWLEHGVAFTSTMTSPNTPGTYSFRARLRNESSHSGWSPKASFTVT